MKSCGSQSKGEVDEGLYNVEHDEERLYSKTEA